MLESSTQYLVEIVENLINGSCEIAKCMGPMTLRKAERVKRAAEINLNHEKFFVRIEEA